MERRNFFLLFPERGPCYFSRLYSQGGGGGARGPAAGTEERARQRPARGHQLGRPRFDVLVRSSLLFYALFGHDKRRPAAGCRFYGSRLGGRFRLSRASSPRARPASRRVIEPWASLGTAGLASTHGVARRGQRVPNAAPPMQMGLDMPQQPWNRRSFADWGKATNIGTAEPGTQPAILWTAVLFEVAK